MDPQESLALLPAHSPAALLKKGDGRVTANPAFLPTELYVLIEPINIRFKVEATRDPAAASCRALQHCFDVLVEHHGIRWNEDVLRALAVRLLEIAISLDWLPSWMSPVRGAAFKSPVPQPEPVGWDWLMRLLEPRMLYHEHCATCAMLGQEPSAKPEVVLQLPERPQGNQEPHHKARKPARQLQQYDRGTLELAASFKKQGKQFHEVFRLLDRSKRKLPPGMKWSHCATFLQAEAECKSAVTKWFSSNLSHLFPQKFTGKGKSPR